MLGDVCSPTLPGGAHKLVRFIIVLPRRLQACLLRSCLFGLPARQASVKPSDSLQQVLDLAHAPKVGLVNGPGHRVMAIASTLMQAVSDLARAAGGWGTPLSKQLFGFPGQIGVAKHALATWVWVRTGSRRAFHFEMCRVWREKASVFWVALGG